MMRSQQAVAFHTAGYLPPEHFDQIFSAHGARAVIFFAAMPLMIGLINLVVPLQLGVRDVAFPTLNSTSFLAHRDRCASLQSLARRWRVRAHRMAALSAAVGDHLPAGVGVDYYLWALQISGVGTLMTHMISSPPSSKFARPA